MQQDKEEAFHFVLLTSQFAFITHLVAVHQRVRLAFFIIRQVVPSQRPRVERSYFGSTDRLAFLIVVIEAHTVACRMELVSVQEYRPIRQLLFWNHLPSHLGRCANDLEVGNCIMRHAVGRSQLELRYDYIVRFDIRCVYIKQITIGIYVKLLLERPSSLFGNFFQGLDELQFQLAVFKLSVLGQRSQRTLDFFPAVRCFHYLFKQALSPGSAQIFTYKLVAVVQDAMVTAIFAFKLALALTDGLVCHCQQFRESLCLDQLRQIPCSSRYCVIHHQIVVETLVTVIVFPVGLQTNVLRRAFIIVPHSQFDTCLE